MKWKCKIKALSVLVGTGLLLQACVKDDTSNCPVVIVSDPPDVPTLKVVFTHQQTDTTIASADLRRAVVYLSDADGKLFDTWQVENPVLGTVYDTGLKPDRDPFGMVAWVNPETPYTISPMYGTGFQGGTTVTDARLTLTVPPNGNFTGALPWLLFGKVDQVPSRADTEAPVEIPLTLDNYIVNVKAIGLPPQTGTYAFMIQEDDGAYDFNNNKVSFSPFFYRSTTHHTPLTGATESTVNLSLTMLRLYEQSNATISFWNETTATALYPTQSGDPSGLIQLIKAALPNNDFAKTHVYDIVLDFTPKAEPPKQPDPPVDPPKQPDPPVNPPVDPPKPPDPPVVPPVDPPKPPDPPKPMVGTVTVYVNGMVVEREKHPLF